MPLILTGQAPLHWALAGAGIGLVTLALLWLAGNRLGISTGFEDVCSLVLRSPYLRRADVVTGRTWRLPFLVGLLLAGIISAVLAHGWMPIWDLPKLDAAFGFGHDAKLGWMFVGGLFIGFGTRLAGGCTSGHGIFGISHLEKASFVSTLSFLGAGVLTTALVYGVMAP